MSKRNQTIAIARFLAYKAQLNAKMDAMTDEDYLKNPIGLDVGAYVEAVSYTHLDVYKRQFIYCPTRLKRFWLKSWKR